MLADFQCIHCGNSESDILIKTSDEKVACKICNQPMQRIYSATKYSRPPRKGTPYIPTSAGSRNRAKFGILD